MRRKQEYYQGYSAYAKGITQNPYTSVEDVVSAENWQDGFDQAEADEDALLWMRSFANKRTENDY